jgi:protein arginine N-methyltransferase 3
MLPSVIWARDRYLKPGGLLVPSHASLWTAPVSDAEYIGEHIDFWRDVYGFDMTAMQTDIYKDVRVEHMPKTSLAGSAQCFRLLDLYTAEVRDLSFTVPWTSTLGSSGAERLDGFLIWFDMFFATTPAEAKTVKDTTTAQEWVIADRDRVAFTTGPGGKETHWKQGLLLTGQASAPCSPGKDSLLRGDIQYSVPDDYARGLIIRVAWARETGTSNDKRQSQSWHLN